MRPGDWGRGTSCAGGRGSNPAPALDGLCGFGQVSSSVSPSLRRELNELRHPRVPEVPAQKLLLLEETGHRAWLSFPRGPAGSGAGSLVPPGALGHLCTWGLVSGSSAGSCREGKPASPPGLGRHGQGQLNAGSPTDRPSC